MLLFHQNDYSGAYIYFNDFLCKENQGFPPWSLYYIHEMPVISIAVLQEEERKADIINVSYPVAWAG